jgi:dienelactone hydrolase
VLSEILTYAADGLEMASILYLDEARTGPRPGVLLFPEAPGLGDHVKAKAQRLAALGYAALACDLHGGGTIISDRTRMMSELDALRADPQRISARAEGALAALKARPEADGSKIAAIGYCFGGTMALELGRGGGDIRAIVGFHSGLATVRPQAAKAIGAKVLACIGADDPAVTAAERAAFEQEMREGGVDWQLHVYGGVVHSFTNPDADSYGMPHLTRYDAGADARSWAAMLALFDEAFAA